MKKLLICSLLALSTASFGSEYKMNKLLFLEIGVQKGVILKGGIHASHGTLAVSGYKATEVRIVPVLDNKACIANITYADESGNTHQNDYILGAGNKNKYPVNQFAKECEFWSR